MSSETESKESGILRAVKATLTQVIKDTATEPGMKHPLSSNTINGLRDCLILITQREQELAQEAGIAMNDRPHFTDEPPTEVVVSFDSLRKNSQKH